MIHKAIGLLGEFKKANEMEPGLCVIPPGVQQWKPPDEGFYKINVDAAIFGEEAVRLGAVVRDHKGAVMLALCMKCPGSFDVDIAEAMAARHGLRVALEAGMRKVILETDCYKLFLQLKKRK